LSRRSRDSNRLAVESNRRKEATVWDVGTVQRLLLSIFGLVIILVGITVGARAKRADYADTARIGFNVVIAMVIVALGTGAVAFSVFGKQILRLLGVSV
jgi:uncharacterized membrane protein